MHRVVLSLAANCDHKKNLSEARRRLEQILFSLSYTRELWTEPIGTKRPDHYLNQLATGFTDMTVDDLCQWFKDTELSMGRTNSERCQGIVRIDLDLLQFDTERYHLRDWDRPYIQALLPEIQSSS